MAARWLLVHLQVRLGDTLREIGLLPEDLIGLMSLRVHASSFEPSSVRVDISHPRFNHFMNNIEEVEKLSLSFSPSRIYLARHNALLFVPCAIG